MEVFAVTTSQYFVIPILLLAAVALLTVSPITSAVKKYRTKAKQRRKLREMSRWF